jgi:hypothetical protein
LFLNISCECVSNLQSNFKENVFKFLLVTVRNPLLSIIILVKNIFLNERRQNGRAWDRSSNLNERSRDKCFLHSSIFESPSCMALTEGTLLVVVSFKWRINESRRNP